MTVYQKIRKNLEGRTAPINFFATIHGTDPYDDGVQALNALIQNNQVREVDVNLPGLGTVTMYSLVHHENPKLVVDNSSKVMG